MNCPICKKPVENCGPFAPFCSDRCRVIDLGNWASDVYKIPVPPEETDEPPDEGGGKGEA